MSDSTSSKISVSELYWELFRESTLPRRLLARYRPYICPLDDVIAHISEGSRVLDIGCGSGLLLFALGFHRHAVSGLGIDTSQSAISAAKVASQRLNLLRPGADLRFKTAAEVDPSDSSIFDAVTMVDVLHHVPAGEQKAFVLKASAHVRPGGRFVYKDMCRRPRWRAAANRLHDLVLAQQWSQYRDISTVVEWLRDDGFFLDHTAAWARLWYGHELAVFSRPR